MSSYKTLNEFLRNHKASPANPITHTRIGNGKDIYGGSYSIPADKMDTFNQLYFKHIQSGKPEYLTEVQLKNDDAPFYVDLDLRYAEGIETRQFNKDCIEDVVFSYSNKIRDMMGEMNENNVKWNAYVMMRNTTTKGKKGENKDGLHILFDIKMNHTIQQHIRNEVKQEIYEIFEGCNLINNADDICDEGITKGTTNAQLYGSRKPDYEPYELKYVYTIEYDNDGDVIINQQETPTLSFELIHTLSVRNTNNKVVSYDKNKVERIMKVDKKPKRKPRLVIDGGNEPNCFEEDKELADIIDLKYIDNYNDWTKLIWSCKTIDNFELAHYISKRGNKYDGNEDATLTIYNQFTDARNGFSKATFYHYAKISNKSKYLEIRSKYHSFDEASGFTDNKLAKTFCKLYGCDHIYYDKIYYYFNGVLWEKNDTGSKLKLSITNDLSMFYSNKRDTLKKILNTIEDESKRETIQKKIKGIDGIIKKLEDAPSMNNVFKMITIYIEKGLNEIVWEENPYLFAFKNKIYDLKNCCWSSPRREDYVCVYTGYDWIEPSTENKKVVDDLINTIFPFPEEKKTYMTILATGLCGKTLEKFVNANGSGGNGKGVLNELMETMLGGYAYNCANAVLLAPIKDGNNPTIANMMHMRMVFYREPDTSQSQKLNISTMKELTGGKSINARLNYSNNTKTILCATHILECNERPKLSGRVDDAVVRRLIDVPFRSVFTSKPDEYYGEYVFKSDATYKTNEFQNTFKFALFSILLDYWKEYLQKNEDIDEFICESVKARTNEYLEDNDEFKNWFDDNYEKTSDKTDVLQINDIYKLYKESETWVSLMSKRERRDLNKKAFLDKVSGNIHFRKYYKEREKSKVVQEKYNVKEMRNVLVGFKRIEPVNNGCMLDIDDEE